MSIPGTVAGRPSFARFVLPLFFPADTFDARVGAIYAARWTTEGRTLPIWTLLPLATQGMLPHVARHLNPPSAASVESTTARAWQLHESSLNSEHGLGGEWNWEFSTPRWQKGKGGRTIPFAFDGFELMLFCTGVGFLTIRANPETSDPDTWLDFLHSFRFMFGRRDDRGLVRAHALGRGDGWTPEGARFPQPAHSELRREADWKTLEPIVGALLRPGDLPGDDPAHPWWDYAFVRGQLLPFVGLWIDDLPQDATAPLLHRLRHFFAAGQGGNLPAEDLRLEGHRALLPYANEQWLSFSLDGSAFFARDAPDKEKPDGGFNRNTLPQHLQQEYFLTFLVALHQRFALMDLSEDVARYWVLHRDDAAGSDGAFDAFDRIRGAFLTFTARGMFAQVMQTEHHHRAYRRWQETFQLSRLYQEVSDELRELHGHLLLQRTAQLEAVNEALVEQREASEREAAERKEAAQQQAVQLEHNINRLGLLLGGPALALTYVGAVGPVSWLCALGWLLVGLLAGAATLAVIDREARTWWSGVKSAPGRAHHRWTQAVAMRRRDAE